MIKASKFVLAFALASGLASAGIAQEMNSSDETITQNVKAMIAQQPALKADRVTVETRQGVVYLKGMVDTAAEKKDLESVAMQTSGVKKVVNGTTVSKSGG
ncbi:MAG TPA: BON domain-containing protein [Magnetospirillaceae bacterium]|nr:BON domain-containing protein [Magnetospirillaceae bacterium]